VLSGHVSPFRKQHRTAHRLKSLLGTRYLGA
jgi:hypothetical protein